MFTGSLRESGQEDALVSISAARLPELTSRPGNVIVRDTGAPFVNAVRRTPPVR